MLILPLACVITRKCGARPIVATSVDYPLRCLHSTLRRRVICSTVEYTNPDHIADHQYGTLSNSEYLRKAAQVLL